MKKRKIIFDTKNPLWLSNGWRISVFITAAIAILTDFTLLTVHIITIRNLSNLIYSLLLMILPFSSIAIKFLSQLKYYLRLKKVVRAEGLVDYKQDPAKPNEKYIVNGVKIEVWQEKTNDLITYLKFYPNGIKNHEKVRALSSILSELFNMNCTKKDDALGHVTYMLYGMPNSGEKVSDSDFF